MSGPCRTNEQYEKFVNILVGKPEEKRPHWKTKA